MKSAVKQSVKLVAGEFPRPVFGPKLTCDIPEFPLTRRPGWQSNGGAGRGDIARSLPFSIDIPMPDMPGSLVRVHLVGIFAINAGRGQESPGTMGAVVNLVAERAPVFRLDLINGRHYSDASLREPVDRLIGDGASVETLGSCLIGDVDYRVDVLTIDVPASQRPEYLRFRDLGSPASFVLFDVFFEIDEPTGCPFRARSGGIGFEDLGAIIRVGDRVRLVRALDQLESALLKSSDLDEARGQALTFIAVVTAATIEMGASREMHRVQLDAARKLDRLHSLKDIVVESRRTVEQVAAPLFEPVASPSGHLIDRALAILNRNFAKDLTDQTMANELGLSTSHFRFLFRESTGQPFHKYLIGLRLERARNLLVEATMPVSEVAAAVGFSGLAHFSRAFTQRFSVSPSTMRRGGAALSGNE